MCRNRQQGVGLIAAIFLIVVVAALAVGIASLVRTGAAAFSLDVLSLQAFTTAESGAQLGLNRVFAPSGGASCDAQTFFTFDAPGLPDCVATVTCTETSVQGESYYDIESAGHCGAGAEAAERRVLVRAKP